VKLLLTKMVFAASFLLLVACAGQGGAGPEGSVSSGGPVGGGQGQPTIAPGADHQPGIPVEDESFKNTLAPAPDPTENPDDGGSDPWGPQKLQAP